MENFYGFERTLSIKSRIYFISFKWALFILIVLWISATSASAQSHSIIYKTYSNISYNSDFNTNISVDNWDAAIVGFDAGNGDLNESGSGSLMWLKLKKIGGKWHINAYMRRHKSSPKFTVNVMFVSKGFSLDNGNGMTVKNDGKVGIGTSSPSEKLEVENGRIKITGQSNSYLSVNSNNYESRFWTHTNGELYIQNNKGIRFTGVNGNPNYMRILDNGNVGIGTSNPSEKLHVSGNALFNNSITIGDKTGAYAEEIDQSDTRGIMVGNGTDNAFFGVINRAGAGNTNTFNTLIAFGDDPEDDLQFKMRDTEVMRLTGTGNLGLGTNSPTEKLHVSGSGLFNNNLTVEGSGTINNNLTVGSVDNATVFRLFGTAQVKEIHMDPTANWSDFVFDDDYKLKPLAELESYINRHKHLPDIPSAKEVAKQGYKQSEINALLLQKIEELTLYIIDLKKTNDELRDSLNNTTPQKD